MPLTDRRWHGHWFTSLIAVMSLTGCAATTSQGRRSRGSPQLLIGEGVRLDRVRLRDDLTQLAAGPHSRLWVSPNGEPRIWSGRGIVIPETSRFLQQSIPAGVDGIVSASDGVAYVSIGGSIRAMYSGALHGSMSMPGSPGHVLVAPASMLSFYIVHGGSVSLLTTRGEMRTLARLAQPITAIAGTGDLTFVATANGTISSLRLGGVMREIARHGRPIQQMAIDASGYLLLTDDLGVHIVHRGSVRPLALGLDRPQIAASRRGTFVFEPSSGILYMIHGIVAIEGRL